MTDFEHLYALGDRFYAAFAPACANGQTAEGGGGATSHRLASASRMSSFESMMARRPRHRPARRRYLLPGA